MTTIQRINNLFEQSGKSRRSILLELKLSTTALAEWNRGKSNPTIEAIVKISRYFNVSSDYLLCLTDEPKPLKNREIKKVSSNVPVIVSKMPALFNEQRFVNVAKIYNELPDEYRERAFGLIMGIAVGLGINVENILRR